MADRFVRELEHRGTKYEVTFFRRPFREGLEVTTEVNGEIVRVAELGLGEIAALEKLKVLIDQVLDKR